MSTLKASEESTIESVLDAAFRKHGNDFGRQLHRATQLWEKDPQAALEKYPEFAAHLRQTPARKAKGE